MRSPGDLPGQFATVGLPGRISAASATEDDMNRRIGALAIAGIALAAGPGVAWADAPPNPNDCNGVIASGASPEEEATAAPSFGETTRGQAQAGIRDDLLRGVTEAFASCGTP
jgi:hypothetical protein